MFAMVLLHIILLNAVLLVHHRVIQVLQLLFATHFVLLPVEAELLLIMHVLFKQMHVLLTLIVPAIQTKHVVQEHQIIAQMLDMTVQEIL